MQFSRKYSYAREEYLCPAFLSRPWKRFALAWCFLLSDLFSGVGLETIAHDSYTARHRQIPLNTGDMLSAFTTVCSFLYLVKWVNDSSLQLASLRGRLIENQLRLG